MAKTKILCDAKMSL